MRLEGDYKEEAEREVATAASWLDGERPGWADLIRVEEFDISDCEHCISHFVWGVHEEDVDNPNYFMNLYTRAQVGVGVFADVRLNDAWVREITERQTP